MKTHNIMLWRVLTVVAAFVAALTLTFAPGFAPDFNVAPVYADHDDDDGDCSDLPSFAELRAALAAVVAAGGNGGLGNDMWATVVNRDGIVCAVAFSGEDRGDQWPGSRVISAQKANTANAFSLPENAMGFDAPLSTANLHAAVQPGGSLYGLQHSNPVDTDVAYRGKAKRYGTKRDPMRRRKIGGVNVFGGGLALYEEGSSILVGAIGVSGDTSCTDHIIAWKVRDRLELDNIPGGVAPGGTDNIIFIGTPSLTDLQAAFTHPLCDVVGTPSSGIAGALPLCFPTGAPVGPVLGADPPFC